MKVTVKNLTSEQIVELHNASVRDGDETTARICADALSSSLAKYAPDVMEKCLARIVEILNARGAK